jgi:WD40 repeat protein
MSDSSRSPVVERERARSATVVELARHLSIASQIEPALLRAMRLRIFRSSSVGLESELWFSPLIQVRDPSAIALRPDVRLALQDELRRAGNDDLSRAWEVIRYVHENAPPVMRLEEEATYLALAGRISDMERLLGGALEALANDSTTGVASWFARSIGRLPREARQSAPALALAKAASAQLGGIAIRGILETEAAADAWSPDLLRALPKTRLQLRLIGIGGSAGSRAQGLLEIHEVDPSRPPADIITSVSAMIEPPVTRPIVLDVLTPTETGWKEQRQSLSGNGEWSVTVPLGPIVIVRDLIGNEVRLKPLASRQRSALYLDRSLPDLSVPELATLTRELGWDLAMSGYGSISDLPVDAKAEGDLFYAAVSGASSPPVDIAKRARTHLIRRDEERLRGWVTELTRTSATEPVAPPIVLEPFYGRKDVFDALRSFCAGGYGGVSALGLVGDAGVGKSAILREFARNPELPTGVVIYRAFDDEPPDLDELGALLATAIPDWQKFDPQNASLSGHQRFKSVLSRLVAAGALRKDKLLVLAIDGLDGPDKDLDPMRQIRSLLPQGFPDGFRVITTFRDVKDERWLMGAPPVMVVENLAHERWRESNRHVVEEFWRASPRGTAVAAIEPVAEFCEGNVRVAEMLQPALESRPRTLSLRSRPRGLRGIVQMVAHDIEDLGPERDQALASLELFGVIREPVPANLHQMHPGIDRTSPLTPPSVLLPLLKRKNASGPAADAIAIVDRSSLLPILSELVSGLVWQRGHERVLDILRALPDLEWARDYLRKYSIRHLANANRDVDAYCRDAENIVSLIEAVGYERGRKELEWLDAVRPSEGSGDPIPRTYQRIIEQQAHWLRRDPAAIKGVLWNQLRLEGNDLENPEVAAQFGLGRPEHLRLVTPLGRRPGDSSAAPVFPGHTSAVAACAIAKNQPRIVSASRDGTVRVWDLRPGEVAPRLHHTGAMCSCAISSDGGMVAAGAADGTVFRWHPEHPGEGTRWERNEAHRGAVTACVFSERHDVFITAGEDGTVRIWPMKRRGPSRRIASRDYPIIGCAVIYGSLTVVYADGTVTYIDIPSGEVVREFRIDPPIACAFQELQLTVVALHLDQPPTSVNLTTGEIRKPAGAERVAGLNAALTAVATNELGGIIARAEGRRITITRGGTSPLELLGHRDVVRALTVGNIGNQTVLISASDDNTLKVWDLETGYARMTLGEYGLPSRLLTVASVTGFPGIPVAAAGNVAEPARILTYPAGPSSLGIANLETHSELPAQSFLSRPSVCLSTIDGRVLVGFDNGEVRFLRGAQATSEAPAQPLAPGAITSLIQHDTTAVCVAGTATGQLTFFQTPGLGPKTVDGHRAAVTCLATHPKHNLLVSAGEDGTVLLWNVHDGAVTRRVAESSAADRACVFSPDGDFVVIGSSTGAVEAFNVSQNASALLEGHLSGVNAVAFAQLGDHTLLVTASDDATLNLLEWSGGRRTGTLVGHTRSVTGCIAIPGLPQAISWSLDRTIKLWDLEAHSCIATLYGNAPFVALTLLPSAMARNELRRLEPVRGPLRLAALDALGGVWIIEVGDTVNRIEAYPPNALA